MYNTVRDLAAASGLPRLEARMLLEHALGVSRTWLLAHDTDPLPAGACRDFERLAGRRRAGEPMAYLVGRREFMGRDFAVTPDVLIPRPETELLVETALDLAAASPGVRILDLGTGSGAIAVSLALALPRAEIWATDASAPALEVARANAQRLGARLRLRQGDWYAALPPGLRFDLVVSNPPYIAAGDPHLEQGDLRFEPATALTDGADGLAAVRAIVADAPGRLVPGGALWLEHGWDQAEAVRACLAAAGFGGVASRRDLAGIERISGGALL